MRHHNKNKKFGRQAGERQALIRSLVVSLIVHEKITTTEAKAKSLRPIVEKMVSKARVNTIPNVRLLQSRLNNNKTVIKKLFTEIAPKYIDRNGGYTRITKLGERSGSGDAASMAVIEFV